MKRCPVCNGEGKLTTGITSNTPRQIYAVVKCKKCGHETKRIYDVKRDGSFVDEAVKEWNDMCDESLGCEGTI